MIPFYQSRSLYTFRYTFTGGGSHMSTLASEKFFYIMDYSSHYYRVDSKDQLVAAVSENEATIFSFADANRRIGALVRQSQEL